MGSQLVSLWQIRGNSWQSDDDSFIWEQKEKFLCWKKLSGDTHTWLCSVFSSTWQVAWTIVLCLNRGCRFEEKNQKNFVCSEFISKTVLSNKTFWKPNTNLWGGKTICVSAPASRLGREVRVSDLHIWCARFTHPTCVFPPRNFFRTQIGSNGRFARVVSYVVRQPTPAVFRQRDPMNVRPTAVEKRLTRLSTLIVKLLLVIFGFCWTRFLDLRLVGLDWTLFTAFICFHRVCVFICIFGR